MRHKGSFSFLLAARAALALMAVSLAHGGEPPAGATAQPATNTAPASIKVTVLDSAGTPVPGARVQSADLPMEPARLTDAQGELVLKMADNLRPQMTSFFVRVDHTNFATRTIRWIAGSGGVYSTLPEEVTFRLQPGIRIGGTVQDERGQPAAGIRILLSGWNSPSYSYRSMERRTDEYTELDFRDLKSPAAVTDPQGRWSFDHFPADLEKFEISFVRPDGSRDVYKTRNDELALNYYPQAPLQDLRAERLAIRLSPGVTVRGIVVDEKGQPLPDVTVKEGYGHNNIVRLEDFQTDASGRFERSPRVPRQYIYTASAPDRATVSTVADVKEGMPEVRLVLPLAKPWVARVVDESGKAVPGVEFLIDPYRTEAQILDWKGVTDAAGLVAWTNAPDAGVVLYVSNSPELRGVGRKVRVTRARGEQLITLTSSDSQEVAVRIRARDAVTGAALTNCQVSARFEGGTTPFKPASATQTTAGEYTLQILRSEFRAGMYPAYELKLEARGYEAFTVPSIDFALGDQDLSPALKPANRQLRLKLLQPDGQPAAGARVWVNNAADGQGSLYINAAAQRFTARDLLFEQANAEGVVEMPAGPDDAPVFVAHTNGFLQTTMGALGQSQEVRVPAYGTVRGQLLVAGKPVSGERLGLNLLVYAPKLGFSCNLDATTEPDGSFVFKDIPAGEYKLWRWKLPKRNGNRPSIITETWQMPVTVVAGKTNIIDYSFKGRPVVGRVVADRKGVVPDWEDGSYTLVLALPAEIASPRRPNREDYATFEAFKKANLDSFTSAALVEKARRIRTYPLEMTGDGSFRAEDVPPGAYMLSLQVFKPSRASSERSEFEREKLGTLTREVVVPEGREAFDLGELTVSLSADLPPAPSPLQAALNAKTLDGKPFSLEQFKGKHVVLVFWAAWSGRSLEELARLKRLCADYASRKDLAFVGVSLDETAAAAEAALSRKDYPWKQTWLDAGARVKAAQLFELDHLPLVFLLDPEGRLVARDLAEGRLGDALKRALASPTAGEKQSNREPQPAKPRYVAAVSTNDQIEVVATTRPPVSEWVKVKIGSAGDIYISKKPTSLEQFSAECARLNKAGGAIVLFLQTTNNVVNPAQEKVVRTIVAAGVGMKLTKKESDVE